MIRTLTEFVEELRAVGIPVSMVEAIDAAEACRFADLSSPEALRAALGATMVKNARHYPAFEVAFDVFFGLRPPVAEATGEEGSAGAPPGPEGAAGAGGTSGGGEEELFEAIVAALAAGDLDGLRRLVAAAVTRLAGMEPGRPVGGRYYLYRVMRRLDADRLRARLLAATVPGDPEDPLAARLAADAADRLVATFRRELRREILRRLVADRGAADVARTLRVPLVEDLDLLHATREELARIERAVAPLARKLATRLAQRRRRGTRGRLDVRRTIRRSLAHGGVLLDPRFRPPRRSKPELVLLCDVSGSMATFARFTMQLAYAVAGEFSRVRSFAFVDGIDEVTGFFDRRWGFPESLARMAAEANLVRRDGHSDYGAALGEFWDRFAEAVGPRSTVVVTGDARNNYRSDGREYLALIAERSRALFWLNPEARRYWNTGDSIMASYASVCDVVAEVRTLRQLEAFVARAALPAARRVYGAPAVP